MVHQVACKHCGKPIRGAHQKAADHPGTIIGILSRQECINHYKNGVAKQRDYSDLRIYIIKVTWFTGGYTYLRTAGWSDSDALDRMQRRVTEACLPARILEIHSTAKLPI